MQHGEHAVSYRATGILHSHGSFCSPSTSSIASCLRALGQRRNRRVAKTVRRQSFWRYITPAAFHQQADFSEVVTIWWFEGIGLHMAVVVNVCAAREAEAGSCVNPCPIAGMMPISDDFAGLDYHNINRKRRTPVVPDRKSVV